MVKQEKKARKHKGLGWTIFLILALVGVGLSVILLVPFGNYDLSPAPDTAVTAEGGLDYGIPLDPMSPWAKFRANALNNGRSPVDPLVNDALTPWSYRTEKGIFSSPVVDANGNCYIGSADTVFYCFSPDGSVKWRYQTGEIIDSSALLDDQGRVYFGSGDANVYCLDRDTGELIWKSPAQSTAEVEAQYDIETYNVNWFEGNIGMLPDGTLLAPNDNYLVYALNREDGARKNAYLANEMVWSLPSVNTATGHIFFASCYQILQNVFAYDVSGERLWKTGSFGTVAATTLLTSNAEKGAVIVGGFDGFVRAFAQDSGKLLWKFGTRDHIYASPAQMADGTIIQGGTDGTLCAIDPQTTASVWEFDTLEPIRSSPAIDARGNIYFGNGEGKLYCVNPDGSLRWSYQCISDARNDLNGSPALGYSGVFIAGESGEVFFVPYDYPLSEAGKQDPRCYSVGEAMPEDGVHFQVTSAFGSTLPIPPETLDANEPITISQLVRADGNTALSALKRDSVRVTIPGNEGYRVDIGANNRFLTIVPARSGWKADASGNIIVKIEATFQTELSRFGLKFFGGKDLVPGVIFLQYRVTQGASAEKTFQCAAGEGVQSVIELSRLSVPTPSILPSYNQIGFDSLHYILGAVDRTASGDLLLWAIEGRLQEDGTSAIDPTSATRYPMLLHEENGLVTLYNDDGFKIKFIGSWDMPFASYRISAPLAADGSFARDADVVAVTNCDEIAFYGLGLKLMGMSEFKTGQMFVRGGVKLTRRADASKPDGIEAWDLFVLQEKEEIYVGFNSGAIRADEHVFSILVTDKNGNPLPLYYTKNTIVNANEDGTIGSIQLKLDKGEKVPADARVYVMVDTYPIFIQNLQQ
jgi:outer membrane protein assembly factor BamB